MYREINYNPQRLLTGDCVIRSLSAVLDQEWEITYAEICAEGYKMADMPSANRVWGKYLKDKGYECAVILNTCPDCYTVRDFCRDHQDGKYIIGTGTHVIAVIDGDYIDTWDSCDEIPIYYWEKK